MPTPRRNNGRTIVRTCGLVVSRRRPVTVVRVKRLSTGENPRRTVINLSARDFNGRNRQRKKCPAGDRRTPQRHSRPVAWFDEKRIAQIEFTTAAVAPGECVSW